jgi:hypothetical protein
MTAVSQLVPNFFGGINEQPDELKKPGQVKDCVNFLPDVTYGLRKRPGLKWIEKLEDISGNGTWIEFTRKNDVGKSTDFIGYIETTGKVYFWDFDGNPEPVLYSKKAVKPGRFYTKDEVESELEIYRKNTEIPLTFENFSGSYDGDFYLDKRNRKALKYVSVKDNILITNPAIRPRLNNPSPTEQEKNHFYAFIEAKVFDNTRTYELQFNELNKLDVSVDKVKGKVTGLSVLSTNKLNNNKQINEFNQPACIYNQAQYTFEGTSFNDANQRILGSNTLDPDQDGENLQIKSGRDPVKIEFRLRGQQTVPVEGESIATCKYDIVQLKIIDGGDKFKQEDVIRFKCRVKRDDVAGTAEGRNFFDLWLEVTDVENTYRPTNGFTINNEIEDPNGNTLPTTDFVSIQEILTSLKDNIVAEDTARDALVDEEKLFDKVEVVGNGIYLESQRAFLIQSSEMDLFNILNSEKKEDDNVPIAYVNNIANLPLECSPKFKVKVLNSFSDKDDAYFKFLNSNPGITFKDENDNVIPEEKVEDILIENSGQGYWVEIGKPFDSDEFRNKTMPHAITSTGAGFVVSRINWKKRTAGDASFNPSFTEDEAKITALNFFKNRLILLTTAGTIITSTAENIIDLFPQTALTTSVTDPIDIIANSSKTDPLYDSIVTNNGLVVFGGKSQYQFFTSSDILSPNTVTVTQIAGYDFEPNSTPQMLSTNISFVTSSEATRMYEMTNVFDRGQVDVNERSKIIQAKFNKGYTYASSSRTYNLLAYTRPLPIAKNRVQEDIDLGKIMWVYIYLKDSSQSDQQTAWVRFEFPHPVKHHFFKDDKMYVITGNSKVNANATECYYTSLDVGAFNSAASSLDNMTEFVDYWKNDLKEEYIPWELTSNETIVPSVSTKDTDGSPHNITGIKYNCQVDLPKYYLTSTVGSEFRSDTTASLTMHRYKINHGAVGAYYVDIKRTGKPEDDYKILYEQPYADGGIAGDAERDYPIALEQEQTVPVYDRNTNINISIRSDFNLPCIIYSLRWEGDYTNRYYRRV